MHASHKRKHGLYLVLLVLQDGLGDTIRVSLTEPPEEEIDPCTRLANLGAQAANLQIGVVLLFHFPWVFTYSSPHSKYQYLSVMLFSLSISQFLIGISLFSIGPIWRKTGIISISSVEVANCLCKRRLVTNKVHSLIFETNNALFLINCYYDRVRK